MVYLQLPIWLNQAPLISHQGQLEVQVPLEVELTPEIKLPQSVPQTTLKKQNSTCISPSQLSNPNPKKNVISKVRKANSGFQTSSHRHVAQELRKHFPEVEHVLACKDASRFGWDKISCEVTASDAVWDKFLLVMLTATDCSLYLFTDYMFDFEMLSSRTQMLKESREHLSLSFGSWKLSLRLLELQSPAGGDSQSTDSSLSGMDPNLTSADESGSRNAAVTYQISTKTSTSACLSRSHVKKDSIAVAIESLVGFLNSQTNKLEAQRSASQPSSSNANDKKTNIQQAMVLYQEVHAPHASKEDSLAAFKIFRNNINAQIFTSITNDGLCTAWLQKQIQE
ncbi:uncharacterized protein VP01_4068g1 [Puccinia sorghi]|uniref:Myb/SANT-like domain-containing protein n=1 Tax=Puccinia sorghi TaxID=27349 RepID=A0A0L6URH5_9BASI|nr:uncharacterized protein VP01_4068g1 [Puccinia sorghi]